METAHRASRSPPEAQLWNSDQPLADRVPKSRVETTPTAARMNREAYRDTGTGLVPALQALGTTVPPHLPSVNVVVTEAAGCAVEPDQEFERRNCASSSRTLASRAARAWRSALSSAAASTRFSRSCLA